MKASVLQPKEGGKSDLIAANFVLELSVLSS